MSYVSVVHLKMVKEDRALYHTGTISNSLDVVKLAKELFDDADREMFAIISVNNKNVPIATEIISIGTINSSLVDVKSIFKHMLLCNATGFFCCHNHPSGNVSPSREDMTVTKKIKSAADILGFTFLDHVIVGDRNNYYSFRESGNF